jgi:Tachylectin
MDWVGVKRLAVVPTINTQFDPPPPPDWSDRVRRRVFDDPDPDTGIDRSLRRYIEAVSYGRAILEAEVFPIASADGFTVLEAAADSLPEGHGYEYLLCVIPMYDGHVHRRGYFQVMTRNGVTYRAARVAMNYGPFRQSLGVWAMEVLHAMADLPDLYTAPLPPGTARMDRYDNMTDNAGTHSCAELKLRADWLAPADFVTQDSDDGESQSYDLHSIGLSGPPPGRVASVRFPGPRAGSTMRVEARLRSDVYESGFATISPGKLEFQEIPSEAVLVYEVGQAPDDISLHAVLAPGQRYETGRSSVMVQGAIPDGFSVSLRTNPNPAVSGRLLFYRDLTQNGTGDVSNPSVIGLGGWQAFKFLFSGGNGVIYAVNEDGQLLFYRDTTQDGSPTSVSDPSVIGLGGWQAFKFLFSGGNGIIYAVVA